MLFGGVSTPPVVPPVPPPPVKSMGLLEESPPPEYVGMHISSHVVLQNNVTTTFKFKSRC